MYEHIPDELKQLSQWVCWRGVPGGNRAGKLRKVPINAKNGAPAQSNNPETWTDFDRAEKASASYNGIGFMFANGYFGIDIDDCDSEIRDYKNGGRDNIIAEFISSLESYAEYSVSGNGIHIICRGALPPGGRRRDKVEMYETGRFFIMTGIPAAEYRDIADCTEKVKVLHKKYIGAQALLPPKKETLPAVILSEHEILTIARRSKYGAVFDDYYKGNWQGYSRSQSEADMNFCNMLAFWCRRDIWLMDRIFRSSGLMRDKWDRPTSGSTYGQITLKKAVDGCKNIYNPKGKKTLVPNMYKQVKTYTLDDTGNAQRFIDCFGDDLRYSFISRKWYYFDSKRWRVDDTGVVKRMGDKVVEEMNIELLPYLEALRRTHSDLRGAQKTFENFVKHCRSNKSKRAMLKEAEHHRPIRPETFDKFIYLLNTPGGTVNLNTGELCAHEREQYLSKITGFPYTAKGEAPLWLRFLDDVFAGDRELIRFIQKAAGYSITGSTKEDCIFFCYGSGRNGKSTFLNVISDILGDYALNVQPETIMARNTISSHTSDLARLRGARFVTIPEPSEGARLNEGLIKQITGGDILTASRKYEDEFEFRPQFKLWMPTNHKPRIHGTDGGIWARIRLIPFTVPISEEKIDRNLRQKLKKEADGILKWAIEGCMLWQEEGLIPPASIRAATAEYRTEMDSLAIFLEEVCERGNYETSAGDLFKAYNQWAAANKEAEMTSAKFGREMTKSFEKVRRNTGFVYQGLRIYTDS